MQYGTFSVFFGVTLGRIATNQFTEPFSARYIYVMICKRRSHSCSRVGLLHWHPRRRQRHLLRLRRAGRDGRGPARQRQRLGRDVLHCQAGHEGALVTRGLSAQVAVSV